MAQRSDALGNFAECSLAGAEVFSSHRLLAQEQIGSMMAEEAGRRRLEALAAKVETCFGLPPPAAPAHAPQAALDFSDTALTLTFNEASASDHAHLASLGAPEKAAHGFGSFLQLDRFGDPEKPEHGFGAFSDPFTSAHCQANLHSNSSDPRT
eukprot:3305011-Rhodomonas_salina.2